MHFTGRGYEHCRHAQGHRAVQATPSPAGAIMIKKMFLGQTRSILPQTNFLILTGFCAYIDGVLKRRQARSIGKSLRATGRPRCFDQFCQKCAGKVSEQH